MWRRSVHRWPIAVGGAGHRPAVTLLLTAAALVIFAWPAAAATLEETGAAGGWWRLVTCHWTHWSGEHLFWDALLFAVLGSIAERRARGRMVLGVAGAAVAVGLVVRWGPGPLPYRGLSGIDSALFVLVVGPTLIHGLRAGDRTMTLAAAGGLVVLAAKTAYEVATGHALFVETAALGVTPVPLAHAVGGGVGLLVALVRSDRWYRAAERRMTAGRRAPSREARSVPTLVSDKPYVFVPPHRGGLWPTLLKLILPEYLARKYFVTRIDDRDTDKLRASLAAGRGILLAPNHCRAPDPLVMSMLSRRAGRHFFMMASSHVFRQRGLARHAVRLSGAFSVYREGADRTAVNMAVELLAEAKRPLVIFPEGAMSRHNDRIMALQEGVPFIARCAARKLAKAATDGTARARRARGATGIVVHPVAIKYLFRGDLEATLGDLLDEMETRLAWRPQRALPLIDRIYKLGDALLTVKEIEFLGRPQPGTLQTRLRGLIDRLLVPLEEQWLDGPQSGPVVQRVKRLRGVMVPDLIEGDLSVEERERRWRMIDDLYLAQQLSLHEPGHIHEHPSVDRMLEAVEKFEENLTLTEPAHGPTTVVVQVGDAIDVEPKRPRGGDHDPLLGAIEDQLTGLLDRLKHESAMYAAPPDATG